MLRVFIQKYILNSNKIKFIRFISANNITENDVNNDKPDKQPNVEHDEEIHAIPGSSGPHYRPCKNSLVANRLEDILECTRKESLKIVNSDRKFRIKSLKQVMDVIEFLYSQNVSNYAIIENAYILTMNIETVKQRTEIIKAMSPRDIDDFIPLLKINTPKLQKISIICQRERPIMPGKSRIYYFSDAVNMRPDIVAKYFSTHTFMFDIALDNLFKNLNIFVKYKVAPINILRDLWAFKYKTKSIEVRLRRAQVAQKDKIMPWMVRCPENILEKSLQLSAESRALLGSLDTVLEYLSNRLGYDIETTKYIASKHPAILKVRVTKIKDILDYLLNEANFTPHHIAQVPRIICHSLETTKERLIELKRYGCVPSTLVILCKSKTEYQKFLQNWITIGNSIKKRENQSNV